MKRLPRKPFKTASLRRLVRLSLRGWASERCWQAIFELQRRGSPHTLALVRSLSTSPGWRRRALGLYIASQLRRGRPGRSMEYALEETQALLLAGLRDAHDEVVRAAVSGLGHRPHPAALADLLRLSTHRHAQLRYNVAISLGGYSDPGAIEALLRLASDTDDDVRDWATFELGTIHETVDTPAIRDILWKNLHDHHPDVQGEALVGLANRGDARAVDHLIQHLDIECRVYELEAAERLASPLLAPALRNLATHMARGEHHAGSYWLGSLQRAIAACEGTAPAGWPPGETIVQTPKI